MIQKAKLGVESNKLKLTDTKYRNQRRGCDKIMKLVKEAKVFDQKVPSHNRLINDEDKLRQKIIFRSIKDELAFYVRNHKDMEYSLPDHVQNEPQLDQYIARRVVIV